MCPCPLPADRDPGPLVAISKRRSGHSSLTIHTLALFGDGAAAFVECPGPFPCAYLRSLFPGLERVLGAPALRWYIFSGARVGAAFRVLTKGMKLIGYANAQL